MPDLIVQSTTQPTQLDVIADEARSYLAQSKAKNTQMAYRGDWHDFQRWCVKHNFLPLPALPDVMVLYVTDLSHRCKTSTIRRRLVAISQVHQAKGQQSPTTSLVVRETMRGIARTHGTAQQVKEAAVVEILRMMIETLDLCSPFGIRDRALLLVGFAGAFRRSELVSLDREDVQFTREGVIITLHRSKTDQEGGSRKIGIPYGSNAATCPIRALEDWLEAAQITSGALFLTVNRYGRIETTRLSDKAVARAVKRAAERAGLHASKFAGHSLRAGLATQAAKSGKTEREIMKQTGHKSAAMVRRYIRDGSLFTENAAANIGL